jgi:transposase
VAARQSGAISIASLPRIRHRRQPSAYTSPSPAAAPAPSPRSACPPGGAVGAPTGMRPGDLRARRHVLERGINRLKEWRGLATRDEKRADDYRAMVVLASIVLWLES